jgi:hypothetical protein
MVLSTVADQSEKSNYLKNNYLYAKSEAGYINGNIPVSLLFEHQMGQIEFVVNKTADSDSKPDIVIIQYDTPEILPSSIWNLQTGKLTDNLSNFIGLRLYLYEHTPTRYIYRALITGGSIIQKKSDILIIGKDGNFPMQLDSDLPIEVGKTATVAVNMPVVTWKYDLSVSTTNMSFSSKGESKAFTITSTRTKVVDGKVTNIKENVTYTCKIVGQNATAFSVSGNTVVATENPSTDYREAELVITQQGDGGKSAIISLDQEAKVDIKIEI